MKLIELYRNGRILVPANKITSVEITARIVVVTYDRYGSITRFFDTEEEAGEHFRWLREQLEEA
jgi:DNA-binding transcriptional regulator/RsmH inhibitor MraZ